MRPTRTIGPLVALLSAVTLGLTATSPDAVGAGERAGKPRHDLVAHGKEIGKTNTFLVDGRVSTLPDGKVKVLRNVSGGKYTVWKKARTSSNGHFSTRIYQVGRKRTCFKIQAPATSGYRRTTSPSVGCIYTA
jgi:hypothetical protein